MRVYVDADGCPVRYEVMKVALRLNIPVTFVANTTVEEFSHPLFEMQLAAGAFNAADDWIAERAGPEDIVVTADIPLAERCLEAGAAVLGHRGGRFTPATIGSAMAMRELLNTLRQTGEVRGSGPAPFNARDRSRFLGEFDRIIHEVKRRVASRPTAE